MTLDLEVIAKALLGAEENAPAFGDLLEPGQSVSFRVAGVQGEKGDKGDRGERGFPGDDGVEGPIGPVGEKGDAGDPGKDGADGAEGPRGGRGQKGEIGERGPKGFDGKDGEPGPVGPRGLRGVPGPGGGGGGGGSGGGGSQTAIQVPFTPAGTISATNVQAAIEEVAAEAGTGGPFPPWTDGGNGDVTAEVDDVAKTPITLEAIAGQTGHLFRWYDENGVLKGDIDAVGILDTTQIVVQTPPDTGGGGESTSMLPGQVSVTRNGAGELVFLAKDGALNSFYAVKVPGLGSDNGYVEFTQLNNADTMFLMLAAAAPTSDHLQLWNNNFDAKLFRITKTGAPGTSATAVADADLAAGEVAVYFDPTNGASALKIKGKSLDGTVVSATVPLT